MISAYRFMAITMLTVIISVYIPVAEKNIQYVYAEETTLEVQRTSIGLVVLYDFHSAEGSIVKDRSGVGEPLDLLITDTESVRRSEGGLEIVGSTLIRSEKPPEKLINAVRWTGEITIEAWIRPANLNQEGPARIVTLSRNSGERNFTLGQDKDRFEIRFRTSTTNNNGIPSLSSPENSLSTDLTHIVYSRDRTGRTRIYLNGKQAKEENVPGSLFNWSESYSFALANELDNTRPWLGTYHLVAVYNRNLLPHEVEQNFKAGIDSPEEPAVLAQNQLSPAEQHFNSDIAPLLARQCLECHDSSTKNGNLDLSRKEMAFAGGNNSKSIVPGNADESLVWKMVEQDVMPFLRTSLSSQEKKLLRDWIDSGAVWTTDVIDPTVYNHRDSAGEIWLQRLTVPEYIETVRCAVGVDIEEEAREILPPDLRADGFTNTAYNLNIDLKNVEAYAKLAEIIVERMDVLEFAAQYTKNKSTSPKDQRELISNMGKWLLRGPLEEHETLLYQGIATSVASAGGDYAEAVTFIIEAMLQSPRFIYRVENQRGDGTPWPVGDFELASRMSYILWGAPPDRELMRAADAGELTDRSKLSKQIQRMLEDSRTIDRSAQFISEWLNLDQLNNLRPNPEKFPNWDPKLAADMRNETLEFFKYVAWELNRPLSDLLNAKVTFATPRLASHYGIEPKEECISRYDLTSVPGRGGLLTHGSVLTVGGDDASMVTRGLFVLHDILRGAVKDPPPCVDTTPIPTKPGLTQRAIAEDRLANPSCGGCHSKFETLAFGLEKFDGLGTYHEVDEHGNELRDDGEILFPGEGKPISYQTSEDLMNLLADSPRVQESITWKVTQFALGRPIVQTDVPILNKIHETAQENGGTYITLISAIVMSDLVQMTRTEAHP